MKMKENNSPERMQSSRLQSISPIKKHQRFNSNSSITPSRANRSQSKRRQEMDYKAIEIEEGSVVVKDKSSKETRFTPEYKKFDFPNLYGEGRRNTEIFDDCVKNRIDRSLDGLSCSILTYGISGSGKTHTIFGSKVNDSWENGVLYHSARHLFEKMDAQSATKIFTLRMSFIEIYNESVYDLLSDRDDQKLPVLETYRESAVVPDLTIVKVDCLDELENWLKIGEDKRIVCKNLNNKMSSRYPIFNSLDRMQSLNFS